VSDTLEVEPSSISLTILQEDVRTVGGDRILEDLLGTDQLSDLEDEGVPEPLPKRTKPGWTATTEYRWEKRTFSSKDLPLFHEPNSEMVVDKELLDTIRDLSNKCAIAKFENSHNISSEEIYIFFGILVISGYNTNTDYILYV
jgi:hypothetical protein